MPAPPAPGEMALWRGRLVIADDFVELLLILDSFVAYLDAADGDLDAVAEWCRARQLSFAAMLAAAGRRETAINEALVAGIDPFWGEQSRLARTPAAGFVAAVARVKRCLYDGLRPNLLRYDERANVYRTRFGQAVEVPPAFTDAELASLLALGVDEMRKPASIVVDKVVIKLIKQKGGGAAPAMYRLQAGNVSVLDGFVVVDADFLLPRPC